MDRVLLRGQPWIVRERTQLGDRVLLRLSDPDTGENIEALCPPDSAEVLSRPPPELTRQALTPFGIWHTLHDSVRLAAPPVGEYAALYGGRLSPESYQFAPLARLLSGPKRSLLIADDVGLGKTIEAGICLLELIARGIGRRILIVVPPGLIPQWIDEMWEKFGLDFQPIENSASLDRAQLLLSEGMQPWAYFDRVITSTEYLKRRDIKSVALSRPWDVVVVDEAHYLAESGTPSNPYGTARTRLGADLREATRSLILLTATPHNGYRHSFRSLLELVEPADATLHGRVQDIQRRVARNMIRRLKPQITRTGPDGTSERAFPARLPVRRLEVQGLSQQEKQLFESISGYCSKTVAAAAGSEEADLVSFAMQIVKKRMLSSRVALQRTVENRLEALSSRTVEDPPSPNEVRELQADLPLGESVAERTAARVLRAALSRDAKRRSSEKRQLREIAQLLKQLEGHSDPKITSLIGDLQRDVLPIAGEKAIVFTEYRDTLAAIRDAFKAIPALADAFVELTGGLSSGQRKARIAAFHEPRTRILLATDAASEGLNLQRHCCRIYHVELPWNPNRLEQRNGRVDRHGQTKPPDIRYLHYPDSPEDRVLDRLVQRIGQMHDDRVSTPDILGIVEGSRIEDILGGIDSAAAGERAAESLIRVFETRHEEFAHEIAPLLLSGFDDQPDLPLAKATSADTVMQDDSALESLMSRLLHGCLKPGPLAGTYRIDVPRHLQGSGVAARYNCATFRRSVAVQHPANDVEFIHRLHPLFRAVSAHAFEELTLAPIRNASVSRVAVCRHALAHSSPFALFTFLERESHPLGRLFGVAISVEGQVLSPGVSQQLLAWDGASPGEVSWETCSGQFSECFVALQKQAAKAAAQHVKELAQGVQSERKREGKLLKEEAVLYRIDRLAEIQADQERQNANPDEQMVLFRESRVNWDARRAAVETHYERRVAEIDRYTQTPLISEPQPLGVLLVFPAR